MKKTFEEQARQAVGREIYCGKSLNNLVAQFAYEEKKTPQDILDDIKTIWKANGFVHPADMHAMIIERNLSKNNPYIDALLEIEDHQKSLDPTSHYMRKDQAHILSSLAHLYALEHPNKDIAVFESDAMNLGGTNYELFKRALEEADYSANDKNTLLDLLELSITDSQKFEVSYQQKPQHIKDKYNHISTISYQCADEAIRIMALNAASIIEENGGHIFPVRAGGDEFRIIALGIKPEQQQNIVDQIHHTQTRILQQLNLTQHTHLKKPQTHRGAGFAFIANNLRAINPASYTESSEAEIAKVKLTLANNYKDLQPQELTFSQTTGRISRLRQALLNKTQYDKASLPEAYTGHANTNIAPFTLPHITIAQSLIDKNQSLLDYDDYDQHVVTETIRRIIPIDNSTGLHMPQAIESILTSYDQDAAILSSKLEMPGISPTLITIDISNLAGLNKALTQKGADKLLENIGSIITTSLQDNGIDSNNGSHSVHCGNGLCMIALPPVIIKPNGQYTKEDLITQEKIRTIAQQINDKVRRLNNQKLDQFIADNHLHLEDENKKITSQFQQVGELPSAHVNRTNKGIGITIRQTPVNLSDHLNATDLIDRVKQPQNRLFSPDNQPS